MLHHDPASYDQQYIDPNARPDRGGCLTLILFAELILNPPIIIAIFLFALDKGKFSFIDLLLHFQCICFLLGAIGMLQWKKWGYYLTMGINIASFFIAIYALIIGTVEGAGAIGAIVAAAIFPVILYALVQDKLKYFT